jgi:uncharacterized membrane protein (UPF0127 family)
VIAHRNEPRLVDAASGQTLISRLELATTFWQRFVGWQRRSLPPGGSGILIAPCSSIHTFGMRFPIDVAFLGAHGEVIDVVADVRPWRAVWRIREAIAVLEIASGRCPLAPGMQLRIVAANKLVLPPVLQPWVC